MTYPEKRIELVHFQITKSCNLRCPFCGQWGERGFFSAANGKALTYDEWLALARQLLNIEPKPKIMLWGGEPMVCGFFDELAKQLFSMGFRLQTVTNGTMIHLHSEILNRCFERVYVSIDGLKKLHNSIRGNGVFERVSENLTLIDDKAKVTIMTVATPRLNINEFAEHFKDYKILLQTMIALDENEISQYGLWLKEVFGADASEIKSWLGRGYEPKICGLPENVRFMPHGERAANTFCLSPFRHIHISWNGNLFYCTDFYDFSAGNVRDERITDIFLNEKSERFREEIMRGNCVTCEHCSWRNNKFFV